jgi:hypothetical protein
MRDWLVAVLKKMEISISTSTSSDQSLNGDIDLQCEPHSGGRCKQLQRLYLVEDKTGK